MGKTSLVHELARRKPKGLVFAFVDLNGVTSMERLLEQLVSKSAEACLGPIDGFAACPRGTSSGARDLRIDIAPEGGLAIDFARAGPTAAETEAALDLPERLAASQGKSLVVVFDEFQEVHAVCGPALLRTMRSRFQHHKNVSYAFSGSKMHLLREDLRGT